MGSDSMLDKQDNLNAGEGFRRIGLDMSTS